MILAGLHSSEAQVSECSYHVAIVLSANTIGPSKTRLERPSLDCRMRNGGSGEEAQHDMVRGITINAVAVLARATLQAIFKCSYMDEIASMSATVDPIAKHW